MAKTRAITAKEKAKVRAITAVRTAKAKAKVRAITAVRMAKTWAITAARVNMANTTKRKEARKETVGSLLGMSTATRRTARRTMARRTGTETRKMWNQAPS